MSEKKKAKDASNDQSRGGERMHPGAARKNDGKNRQGDVRNNEGEAKGMESLKEKMESALTNGFERAQDDKVKELNKLSRTGKKITRKDYNSRNLAELYKELGLEYPSGKALKEYQKN